MTLKDIVDQLWRPLTVVPLVLGGLATHLWQRYLNRLAAFRWTAMHTHIAVSGDHPHFGKVEVLWNGSPTKNLHFCTIELENESSRDFSDVEIRIVYADGSQIYGEGQLSGTTQFMPWTKRYVAEVDALTKAEAHKADPAVHNALARREYVIPVFNRGTRFFITYLVNSPVEAPYVNVTLDHVGVRAYQRPQRPNMLYGVWQTYAAVVGLLAALIITVVTSLLTRRIWLVATITFTVAAVGSLLGAGIIRAWRWIVRVVG